MCPTENDETRPRSNQLVVIEQTRSIPKQASQLVRFELMCRYCGGVWWMVQGKGKEISRFRFCLDFSADTNGKMPYT